MPEIKNSKLLEFLLAHAKGTGDHPAALTAPRYLLSALEVFTGVTEFSLEKGEKEKFFLLVDKYFPQKGDDYSELQKQLSSIIHESEESYMDTLYMQRKLFRAKEITRSKRLEEIGALDLLELILKDPDKSVKACLDSYSEAGVKTESQDPTTASGMSADFIGRLEELLGVGGGEPEAPRSSGDVSPEETKSPKTTVSELTEKVKKTHDALSEVIFGQDNAISVFTTGYFRLFPNKCG